MTWFTKTTRTYSGETGLDQGSDGTSEYLKLQSLRMIIGHHNTGATVSFKPMIKNYSITVSSKTIDKSKDYINFPKEVIYTTDNIGLEFDISLDIVAHSINESKINMARLNELERMFRAVTTQTATGNAYLRNIFYVNIANLMTAKYTSKRGINNMEELKQVGVPCFIESYSYDINKEMGMFELGGTLLPKAYNLNLKMKISNVAYRENNTTELNGIAVNTKYLWLPFYHINDPDSPTRGTLYRKSDVQTFPFGITGTRKNVGSDGSDKYSQNKRAYINICGFDNKAFISFKPFIESFSWDYSYAGMKVSEDISKGGALKMSGKNFKTNVANKISFNVVSHSLNEARNNMLKIQRLIRLADQFYPVDETNGMPNFGNSTSNTEPSIFFGFNELTNKNKGAGNFTSRAQLGLVAKPYVLKGLSFSFDPSMGFFEDNGLLYFKKYNISLDLLEKADTTSPYQIRFDDPGQEGNKKEMNSEPVQAFTSERESIGHYVFGKNQRYKG